MLRLRLLGGFEIERAGRVELTRLPSRASVLLLARLALAPRRQHPREELVELLWPGVELDVGRNRLRQTLSTLRALLETDEAPLFNADRLQLSLLPGALASDVHDFEATRLASHYGGELLPGHFDDWVVAERHRLAALADDLPPQPQPVLEFVHAPALPSFATSLPRYLTRYFAPPGRLEALAVRLPQLRLLTLVGPGGVGKTRLAVELAWLQFGEHHWSCGMAALAEVRDEAGLVAALERALTVTRGGGWPAIEAALQDPGGLRLLVLDNAEQALGVVAQAVQRLLAQAPTLCLLVTSRHALEVDGETLVDVAPLASAENSAQDTAQALFIDRARAVRADFHASRDNQAALTELIRELEGLPLALELAAARVRSFSPAQMLAQWRGLGTQAAPLPAWLASPTRAPRHASVAGLLDWSLALLGPEPRALLQRLAALSGAFAWADVEALGGTPALLSELVGHSLLQAGGDAEPRYRMLELLRRGVLAHLDAAEQRQARRKLRAALCDWALALGLQAPITAWAPRREQARALVASAADDSDAATGLRLALAMRPCWESDGVDRTLVDQLGLLLQLAPCSAGHELRAQLAFTHGDRALALAEAERALQLAGSDPVARAPALVRRAWVLLAGDNREQGQTRPLEEAIGLARRVGDVATEARAWQQLAAIAVSRGQPAQAEALYARAQELWEAVGHSRQAAARLRNRAQCLIELGDIATALGWITACQRLAEADGDGVGQLDAAISLAMVHEARRDWPAMLAAARQALRIAHGRQHLHARALTLQLFPRPLARLRHPEQALQLAAFAEQYWQRHLGALGSREARALARVRRLAGAQLSRDGAKLAWASGQTLSLAEALALAGA
ncbi:ATP-binding protein [Roseateles sp. P5_D6]